VQYSTQEATKSQSASSTLPIFTSNCSTTQSSDYRTGGDVDIWLVTTQLKLNKSLACSGGQASPRQASTSSQHSSIQEQIGRRAGTSVQEQNIFEDYCTYYTVLNAAKVGIYILNIILHSKIRKKETRKSGTEMTVTLWKCSET